MSNLMKFDFSFNQNQVRVVVGEDGNPWFVAKDVCSILDLGNTSRAVSRLSDSMKGITSSNTLGGDQQVIIISESGLYKLVFTSRMPEADKFTDWIASEVLPSIRKTGSYSIAPRFELPDFTNPVIAARAWADECEGRMLAESKVLELTPKAEVYDACINSTDLFTMNQVAKITFPVLKLGQNKMYRALRNLGILMHNNLPMQEHVDSGYFVVKERTFLKPNGEAGIRSQTFLTQRGIEYVMKSLKTA